MVSSRQKSLSSLSSAPTTTDAAAQRDLRGKTLPSQCRQEEPAGQFLALSLVSPAEFGFVSSWVYLHDTRPTGTDVVHQERKRNLEQKWAGPIKKTLTWIWRGKGIKSGWLEINISSELAHKCLRDGVRVRSLRLLQAVMNILEPIWNVPVGMCTAPQPSPRGQGMEMIHGLSSAYLGESKDTEFWISFWALWIRSLDLGVKGMSWVPPISIPWYLLWASL